MATRKKAKKKAKPHYVRTKKRKGSDSSALARRGVTVALLLLILVGAGFGIKMGFDWIGRKLFSENPRFEIQHLVISSDGRLSEDRIRGWVEFGEGTNLFAVLFEDIQKALEKDPFVEDVYLERQLPHTLIIKVKERMPVARISGVKSMRYPYMLDRHGFVLPPSQSAASLPVITGVDTPLRIDEKVAHPDVEKALGIIANCNSSSYLRDYVRVESLDVHLTDYIDIRLTGGIRVRMPRYSTKAKLQMLATILKIESGKGKRVKEVDLTVDSSKVKVPVTYY